jgi:hypothetical protein
MRDGKESVLQGMFSPKDRMEAIRRKQDRFSESMDNLSDDREIKDYSVKKSHVDSQDTGAKKVSF